MGKFTRRLTASLWLTAALGAAAAAVFGKPAKIKDGDKAVKYVYTFGNKKKNKKNDRRKFMAVTNVKASKAAKMAAGNFFKNVL